MEIYGYKRNHLTTLITWITIVASGLLLRLVFYWKPHWMLYATFSRCSLREAEKVLLIDKYNQCLVERVEYLHNAPNPASLIHRGTFHRDDDDDDHLVCPDEFARHNADSCSVSSQAPTADQPHEHTVRYFENKKIRYIWNEDERNFARLRGFDKNVTLSKLQSMTCGLSKHEQSLRRMLFGENAIHIEVAPYFKILFQEVLGPFYIFQVFSCVIWFNDNYYYYGTCIIIMSVTSLVSGVVQIRRNQEQLRDTVESIDYVKVCRRAASVCDSHEDNSSADYIEEIDSSELVPGDVVIVPTFNSTLHFDGVLINGNVIVNESMLTGESVPVTKTPVPFNQLQTRTSTSSRTSGTGAEGAPSLFDHYDEKEHSKHTLFCGTKVLQTRYYGGAQVKALVIRVGFQTAKGELIRSIMFPKPVDFRFNRQIHKFVGVLGCLALIGFTYSVILKTNRGADLKTILISALDLITIVVPPALPAAMTIGIIYAQSRLKSNKIFCISPRSINISGCINCVCFDKTGTLTEDNLSFNEVVPLDESKCEFGRPFDEDVMQTNSKRVEREHHLLLASGDYSPLMVCLASCHSLTIIDHKIIGDPLDLQMFEATGWVLEEPDVDDENKFDLLAPTVVRPPKHKRRANVVTTLGDHECDVQETYMASGELRSTSSASSTEDELDTASLGDATKRATKKCRMDVGILRQLPFSSSLQRMSVVTRQYSGSQYVVYAKGAPEKIASLCDPNTIPDNFNDMLHHYTHKGFRVLALAYRPLKAGLSYTRMQRAPRTEIEKDLRFLGLLTLGNMLKEETIPVIRTLNKAAIRCVMVTGDNMLTAVSVAEECGMISKNDRTILLQVEKATKAAPKQQLVENSSLLEVSGDYGSNNTNCDNLSRSYKHNRLASESPLILNVERVQSDTEGECDPILASKRLKKPPFRPRLTYQYMNELNPSNIEHATNNTPMEKQQNSPLIGEADCTGISFCGGGKASLRIEMLNEARIHLALTGDTWDTIIKYYPELLDAICVRGTVFARMSPQQKQQLVEQLQALGYYVGMCGDGANDSGALRSAHAGISLSDAETSVAAPFTSANANISCVPILISEGRAALVTAFGILKYMAMYSLTQFCSVLILYSLYTNFNDMEFLYEDLFIIAALVALFGRTGPYSRLDSKAPPSSLLSFTQLASVGLQIVIVVTFQIISLILLWQNPWYEPHPPTYDHELDCHDNFAIFAISSFQCISLAVIFSKGKPYRKSILSNYLLTGTLLALVVLSTVILVLPAEWNVPYISLGVTGVTLEFRLILVLLALTHFGFAMICESFIVDHLIFKKGKKFLEILNLRPKLTLFEQVDRKTRSVGWLNSVIKENVQVA